MKTSQLFLFFITLSIIVACSKSEDASTPNTNNSNSTNTISLNSKTQLKFALDSSVFHVVEDENGSIVSSYVAKYTRNIITNTRKRVYEVKFENAKGEIVTITRGSLDLKDGDLPSENQFNNLFRKGDYAIVKDEIDISFSDGTGNNMGTFVWRSHTGSQHNSNFKIIDYVYTGNANKTSCKIVAKISCTLYNSSSPKGNIEIKDATLVWEITDDEI